MTTRLSQAGVMAIPASYNHVSVRQGASDATVRRHAGLETERLLHVILPKVRDPRFVTIRRGGTLTDADHKLLALWAADCAEHVLPLFESVQPDDP